MYSEFDGFYPDERKGQNEATNEISPGSELFVTIREKENVNNKASGALRVVQRMVKAGSRLSGD